MFCMLGTLSKNRVSDNIPFTCFYNDSTLLTKNGSLVKTLKFSDVRCLFNESGIRKKLQMLVKKILYNNKADFAFWINTIRRKRDTNFTPESAMDDFTTSLSKKHHNEIEKHNLFYTEFYISIVSDSILKEVAKPSTFLLLQSIKRTKTYGDNLLAELENTVESLTFDLKAYQPQVVEGQEFLDFASSILDCEKGEIHPNIIDIAESIVENKNLFFGFNTFQINRKKFGTVLKLKDYKNTENLKLLNRLINCNTELIFTEIITQISFADVKKEFSDRSYLLKISNDEEYIKTSGLGEVNRKISEKSYDEFCSKNLSVTIFSNDLDELNITIGKIRNALLEDGFSIIRYDLLLESAFWSNFPGNFLHLPPRTTAVMSDSLSFTFTHTHFKSKNNILTEFMSIDGNIHSLSFYADGKPSSVAIIGQKSAGKTALQNFLISEARHRDNYRFLIIDDNHLSKIFINALSGDYRDMDSSQSQINIMDVDDQKVLERILKKLCKKQSVKAAAEKILSVPSSQRMSSLPEILESEGLTSSIDLTLLPGFDNSILQSDTLGLGFNDSDNRIASLVVFYIIHRYAELSKGRPFIIALHNDWRFQTLFESSLEFEEFLLYVRIAGGFVIFSTTGQNNILTGEYKNISDAYIKTRVFIPSEKSNFQYIKSFDIGNEDIRMMQKARLYDKCFYLKQGDEQIILKFDLTNLNEKYVLSSDKNRLMFMDNAISQASHNPNLWIPIFYQQCSQK